MYRVEDYLFVFIIVGMMCDDFIVIIDFNYIDKGLDCYIMEVVVVGYWVIVGFVVYQGLWIYVIGGFGVGFIGCGW